MVEGFQECAAPVNLARQPHSEDPPRTPCEVGEIALPSPFTPPFKKENR